MMMMMIIIIITIIITIIIVIIIPTSPKKNLPSSTFYIVEAPRSPAPKAASQARVGDLQQKRVPLKSKRMMVGDFAIITELDDGKIYRKPLYLMVF